MSQVDVVFEVEEPELTPEALEKAVQVALKAEDADLDISVVLLSDEAIHQLNRQFLEHDYPTDVICFDLRGDDMGVDAEIYVSADTARREASSRNVTFISEVLLYCVHGTLHLLGYDDHEPEERAHMHERQAEILAMIGHETAE